MSAALALQEFQIERIYIIGQSTILKGFLKHSGPQSVNVWCGLKNNRILGPFFFDRSLTGNLYLNMLQNDIENLIDDLPLNEAQG